MAIQRQRARIKEKEGDILQLVVDNPRMKREALAEKMIAKIDWGGKAPEPEVLWKKISKYRKSLKKPGPLDQPWHLGTLSAYPIPPEALPMVIRWWLFAAEFPRENEESYDVYETAAPTFTIRYAQWIGRFYALLKDKDFGDSSFINSVISHTVSHEKMEEQIKGYKTTQVERDDDMFELCQYAGISVEDWLEAMKANLRFSVVEQPKQSKKPKKGAKK